MITANKKQVVELKKYIEKQDNTFNESVNKLNDQMAAFKRDIDVNVTKRMDSIEQLLLKVLKNQQQAAGPDHAEIEREKKQGLETVEEEEEEKQDADFVRQASILVDPQPTEPAQPAQQSRLKK